MGMGIVKLISWEWELLEGNENSTFSHLQSNEEKQPVSGVTSASLGTSATVSYTHLTLPTIYSV